MSDRRPNIIVIIADQMGAEQMSCAGNPYLRTPAIDSIAENGVRFELAYCTNPVCLPSRFSLMTGRMPSEIGARHDRPVDAPKPIQETSMGWLFRQAGYETVFGGKVHLPRGMTKESIGFESLTSDERGELARASAEFIRRKHDRPFLLVSSFINPHDICWMAIGDMPKPELQIDPVTAEILREAMSIPPGMSEREFYDTVCPPLRPNHAIPENEPEAINLLCERRPFRKNARENWSDERWRLHRWTYCRLTERVDRHVARLIEAVRDAGIQEETLIVMTSDHGDMDGAHKMEHKTALYEEAARIPFIFSFPSRIVRGHVDSRHLVSNGLDLLPTLCDYAGIEKPVWMTGMSLRPILEGREPETWRDHILVESDIGNMIRDARFKYVRYDIGKNPEQLTDLVADPGEMRNLAADPEYAELLDKYRQMLNSIVRR